MPKQESGFREAIRQQGCSDEGEREKQSRPRIQRHNLRKYRGQGHLTAEPCQSDASYLYTAWEEQLLEDIRRYLSVAHADLVHGRSLLQVQLIALEQIATHIIRTLTAAGTSELSAFSGERITRRQQQILIELNRGQRPQEIAHDLGISEKTVRTHIRDICDRLEVSGAFAAVQAAKALHLIS